MEELLVCVVSYVSQIENSSKLLLLEEMPDEGKDAGAVDEGSSFEQENLNGKIGMIVSRRICKELRGDLKELEELDLAENRTSFEASFMAKNLDELISNNGNSLKNMMVGSDAGDLDLI